MIVVSLQEVDDKICKVRNQILRISDNGLIKHPSAASLPHTYVIPQAKVFSFLEVAAAKD